MDRKEVPLTYRGKRVGTASVAIDNVSMFVVAEVTDEAAKRALWPAIEFSLGKPPVEFCEKRKPTVTFKNDGEV